MFTHLDKVFWDDEGYTKGDLIAYYEAIASTILPHLKDRPMVLNRHPNGYNGKSFFQKNIKLNDLPSWVETAEVRHSEKRVRYLLVQNKETLLYVANLGCIELNPFHSRVGSLDNPDYMLFDLDPEALPFAKVIEVALAIHALLDEIDFPNFCKSSGGRGLHIYVPLGAKYDYDHVQTFARLISLVIQARLPDLVSLERSPQKRQKRVYIDYPRNARGQTIAAPYCLRPRPHAPASTPLLWKEVKAGLDVGAFDIRSLPKRVAKKGDLFKGVLGRGVDLKKGLDQLQHLLIEKT